MSGSLDHLMAATVLFVGGHFFLSSAPVRAPLVRKLGERGFTILYSIIIIFAFAWMIEAYRTAPYVTVWVPAPAFVWVTIVVMPFALILAVAGLTGPSPTLPAATEEIWEGHDPTAGIIRVTRHPFLIGVILLAISHLLVVGDTAGMIFFGGLLVLAVGGTWHIDKKKEARLGAAWGPVLLTTSVIPFAAILSGRTKMDWRGLGWWRIPLALFIYIVLAMGSAGIHPRIF